jgi:hypothetical protein
MFIAVIVDNYSTPILTRKEILKLIRAVPVWKKHPKTTDNNSTREERNEQR